MLHIQELHQPLNEVLPFSMRVIFYMIFKRNINVKSFNILIRKTRVIFYKAYRKTYRGVTIYTIYVTLSSSVYKISLLYRKKTFVNEQKNSLINCQI